MITLLFSNRKNIGSYAIRGMTWGIWSHVAVIDGDKVIEAIAFHGVREISLKEALDNADHFEIVNLPCKDPLKVISLIRSQIGRPYDYMALLGFLARRDWGHSGAWFCSELIAWAFQQAGEPLFREGIMYRVAPEDIWRIPPIKVNKVKFS